MGLGDDGYKILRDVQRKCNELNQKIDSLIRIMEMFTTYMKYSSMMSELSPGGGFPGAGTPPEGGSPDSGPMPEMGPPPFSPFSQEPPEGSDSMNPNDFQKLMNAAKQGDVQMSEGEFNQIFESLKKGKSAEEAARMEQMLQLAKSFMK